MGIIFSSFNGLEVSPKLRFKDENGVTFPCWKKYTLSHFLSSRVEKQIPTNEAPLMAFTAEGGVTDKGERYDRSFLVKSADKLYKRTEFNDFIYSSNNLDVGSIGLNKYGTAVISDVYEIFSVNKNGAPDFISELIQRPFTLHKVLKFRQGCLYGQYRIYASDFLSVSVFAPQLKEQKKINNFLSLIDKRIEKQRQLVESLKKYKRGALSRVFNDILQTEKLSDISNFISSSRTLSSTLNNNKGIYPVYDATGVAGYIDHYDIDSDYITIVKDGSGVGRLQKCNKKSSFIGTLGALVAKNCTTDFLYAVLQTIDFSKFVTGMAIPHIYYKDYKNTLIPFPCEIKQHSISQFLKKIDEYIENENKKLSNILTYKQGLLQQMFI